MRMLVMIFMLLMSCTHKSSTLNTEKACETLPNIQNAAWDQQAPVPSGGIISARCDHGYKGSPAPSAKCVKGSWENQTGSCVPKKDCKILPLISHGKWNQHPPIKTGASITSTCDSGYDGIPTPPTAVCDDYNWKNKTGACLAGDDAQCEKVGKYWDGLKCMDSQILKDAISGIKKSETSRSCLEFIARHSATATETESTLFDKYFSEYNGNYNDPTQNKKIKKAILRLQQLKFHPDKVASSTLFRAKDFASFLNNCKELLTEKN